MNCEHASCLAKSDYRDSFDLTEDGSTVTIYLDKLITHNHVMKFIFEGSVFVMGHKDGILQIWRDES